MQIAEIATSTNHTAEARGSGVEYGDDHRIVIAHQINHTHDAIATSHTHIHLHTVHTALVDGHQVLKLVQRIIHNLSWNQLVLAQELQFLALHLRGVSRSLGVEPSQLVNLTLQIEVTE